MQIILMLLLLIIITVVQFRIWCVCIEKEQSKCVKKDESVLFKQAASTFLSNGCCKTCNSLKIMKWHAYN